MRVHRHRARGVGDRQQPLACALLCYRGYRTQVSGQVRFEHHAPAVQLEKAAARIGKDRKAHFRLLFHGQIQRRGCKG